MLARKYLDIMHVKIPEFADNQYEMTMDEIGTLNKMTGMYWGIIREKGLNRGLRISFAEGAIVGLGIAALIDGCIFAAKKHREKKGL